MTPTESRSGSVQVPLVSHWPLVTCHLSASDFLQVPLLGGGIPAACSGRRGAPSRGGCRQQRSTVLEHQAPRLHGAPGDVDTTGWAGLGNRTWELQFTLSGCPWRWTRGPGSPAVGPTGGPWGFPELLWLWVRL